MLAWVYQAAFTAQSQGRRIFDRIIVAVDSAEVAELCRARGWEFQMTSPALASGTDRVHAVARQFAERSDGMVNDAIFVNIQGDEPLLRSEHFEALLRPFTRSQQTNRVEVSTVMTPCPAADTSNPNAVKVVVDHSGRALYFSRAPIPWDRDGQGAVPRWKHLGLYGYRKRVLDLFQTLPLSRLESIERLEQLRLLENGIPIQVEPVEFDTIGVDTEADLDTVAALLSQRTP